MADRLTISVNEAVVVGAGPAGLAAAAMLKREGIPVLVIERSEVADSWRRRYDHLRLNSIRWMSDLPGYRMPRRLGRWVSRDDYVAYLDQYASHHALDIRSGVDVQRVEQHGGTWGVRTADPAQRYVVRVVVVATGWDNTPWVPPWPGRDEYRGELIHAAEYRRPDPFVGRKVLIVGGGSSAAEIAMDLLHGGGDTVTVSVRTSPNVFPREWRGVPITPLSALGRVVTTRAADRVASLAQRFLNGAPGSYQLSVPAVGAASALRTRAAAPTTADGFVAALRDHRIRVLPAVSHFTRRAVVMTDGRHHTPDAVIAATGYRRGLEPLVGHLGVLGAHGAPATCAPPQTPGLYFVGYRLPLTGLLSGVPTDARRVARAARRHLTGAA